MSLGTHTLRPATARDLEACRALLRRCALPLAGLERDFPGGYAVADAGGALLGCAGVEVHGDAGLLRSVAVAPEARGDRLGARLVDDAVARARARGLASLWLLTTTAPAFFARLGFRPRDRAGAPAPLRASEEFAAVCPASATCMALDLA